MATRSKSTKSDKARKRSARDREAERIREYVTDMIDHLKASSSAADVLGGIAAERVHGLQHDQPVVAATLAMWKTALPAHALTGLADELAAELARHDAALKALVTRCEAQFEAESVTIAPSDEDKKAIEAAVLVEHDHDH
jgi:hypothetical protein